MEHDAWSITGVLQKTTRHNVRNDTEQQSWGDSVDAVSVFRVSKEAENRENLNSLLKAVISPTLMEVKELPPSFLADISQMKKDLNALVNIQVIVDSLECVNRLGQLLTNMLVEIMGKKLQHVPEDFKKLLTSGNGPFVGRKKLKRLCGTYFELMQYHLKNPIPQIEMYLAIVEEQAIRKFSHISEYPKTPESLRHRLLIFAKTAREIRDSYSHIALLPDGAKESALQLIEENLDFLVEDGLEAIVPLVAAGVYILRHGIPYALDKDVDDDEGEGEESLSMPIKREVAGPSLFQQSHVKVTFVAKKKLEWGHAVSVFGYHRLLGRGRPDHAILMSFDDGLMWSKVIKLPIDVDIHYSYVIVRRRKSCKWEIVDGPFGQFTVHVGTTPVIVETNLEDYKDCEE